MPPYRVVYGKHDGGKEVMNFMPPYIFVKRQPCSVVYFAAVQLVYLAVVQCGVSCHRIDWYIESVMWEKRRDGCHSDWY
jgi:hypothetical protein